MIETKEKELLTAFNLLRDTEVGYLDASFIIYKDVGAFDISVDDISFMQIVQALKNLTDKILHELLLEGAIIAQKGRDRTTRNIFEENV